MRIFFAVLRGALTVLRCVVCFIIMWAAFLAFCYALGFVLDWLDVSHGRYRIERSEFMRHHEIIYKPRDEPWPWPED